MSETPLRAVHPAIVAACREIVRERLEPVVTAPTPAERTPVVTEPTPIPEPVVTEPTPTPATIAPSRRRRTGTDLSATPTCRLLSGKSKSEGGRGVNEAVARLTTELSPLAPKERTTCWQHWVVGVWMNSEGVPDKKINDRVEEVASRLERALAE